MSTSDRGSANPLFTPLSVADAMAITGKSKRTIDRWIREGQLRQVRLDGRLVLVEEDVLNYEKRMWDNLSASRSVADDPTSSPT